MSAPKEGYRWLRLMMVLSSFSPVFLFWAVRGESPFPQEYFIAGCAAMIIIPTAFSLARVLGARSEQAEPVAIGHAEDGKDQLLVYLFAMMLPFYAPDLSTGRNFAAVILALAFVVSIFWYLNLHYINVLFAAVGYRVFTVRPVADGIDASGVLPMIVITKRSTLDGLPVVEGHPTLYAIRLSDSVYLEEG